MDSSREKEFLKLLSTFIADDFPNKEDLTVDDYLAIFGITLNFTDLYNQSEIDAIGWRMRCIINSRINFKDESD